VVPLWYTFGLCLPVCWSDGYLYKLVCDFSTILYVCFCYIPTCWLGTYFLWCYVLVRFPFYWCVFCCSWKLMCSVNHFFLRCVPLLFCALFFVVVCLGCWWSFQVSHCVVFFRGCALSGEGVTEGVGYVGPWESWRGIWDFVVVYYNIENRVVYVIVRVIDM
jgi:hypothetical protein